MDDRDYYRTYAYVSASAIANWVQQGKPEKVEKVKFDIPVKAAEVGTALHALVLETPAVAQQIISDRCRNLGFSEWKVINMMVDAVEADSDFQALLEGCEKELAMFYKGRGMQIKGKADAIHMEAGYVFDVKTSSAKDFQQSIVDYNYHVQAYFYPMLANLIEGGNRFGRFIWGVVGKRNGKTEIVEATKEQLEHGFEDIKEYFSRVKRIRPFDSEVSDYVKTLKNPSKK